MSQKTKKLKRRGKGKNKFSSKKKASKANKTKAIAKPVVQEEKKRQGRPFAGLEGEKCNIEEYEDQVLERRRIFRKLQKAVK